VESLKLFHFKTAALALAVIILSSFSCFAQSKQDKPSIQQPSTQITQQKSDKEQSRAQQQPIIVNVTPAKKTETERAEEAEDGRRKAESDAKLADYTGELAFFTKWLFFATVILGLATVGLLIAAVFQSRDMKASIVAAQRAANVAENSLLAVLRPVIGINGIKLHDPDQSCAATHISYDIQNKGTSGAFLDKVIVTVSTSAAGALTLTEKPSVFASDISASLEQGEIMHGTPVSSVLLGEQEIAGIKSGKMVLRVGFEIRSRDIQGNPWPQSLPYVFDHAQIRFIRAPLIHEKK
jgi:hypothetical protein